MMSSSSYGKKTYGSRARSHRPLKQLSVAVIILIIVSLCTIYGFCIGLNRTHNNDYYVIKQSSSAATGDYNAVKGSKSSNGPTIRSLDDLSPEELHPKASSHRYIVSPPPDDKPISLVTCETTVGLLHIVVQ